MKNGNPKDQLIRQAFEECLSGMDSLPSQRQEINRKMKDRFAEREPVRFRIPAIAAALVMLLCIGVVALRGRGAGVSDMIAPENRYTVQPIETVLSAKTEDKNGEETLHASVPDEKDEKTERLFALPAELSGKPGQKAWYFGPGRSLEGEDAIPEPAGYLAYTVQEDGTAELTGWQRVFGHYHDPVFLVIPQTAGEYPVAAIGLDVFSTWENLNSIILPESVTSIGAYAFAECTGLEIINFPAGLISIGGSAFVDCTSLTFFDLQDGLQTIGSGAFSGCRSVRSVRIPDSVTTIGDSAFSACTGLESVILPGTITYLGTEVFSNCTNLTRIEIPDSVTAIGNRAFYNCVSLNEITLPKNLDSVGSGAFNGCTGLISVSFPDKLAVIENGAFHNCTGLKAVTLPDGLEIIGGNAFLDCGSLSEINLPDSLFSIAKDAFKGCGNLTCTVSEGSYAMKYCVENGINYIVR